MFQVLYTVSGRTEAVFKQGSSWDVNDYWYLFTFTVGAVTGVQGAAG